MKPRKPRLLGPGTVLAIVIAGMVLASNPSFAPRNDERQAKPVDVEQLRAELARQPKPKPLAKPEPGALLSADLEPALDQKQRAEISRVADRWAAEKDALLQAMHATAPQAPTSTTEGDLRTSLSDYSALSRHYDGARNARWQEALAVLTADQRKSLETQP